MCLIENSCKLQLAINQLKNANYEEKKDPAYQNTSKTTKKLPASLPLKETVRNKQINGKKKKKTVG